MSAQAASADAHFVAALRIVTSLGGQRLKSFSRGIPIGDNVTGFSNRELFLQVYFLVF
jgi:hypothetical protein